MDFVNGSPCGAKTFKQRDIMGLFIEPSRKGIKDA